MLPPLSFISFPLSFSLSFAHFRSLSLSLSLCVCDELAKYRQAENNREAVKKNEYITLLHQVKDMRREVKERHQRPVFSPVDITKEQIDFA